MVEEEAVDLSCMLNRSRVSLLVLCSFYLTLSMILFIYNDPQIISPNLNEQIYTKSGVHKEYCFCHIWEILHF